jgi:hypothetical protein
MSKKACLRNTNMHFDDAFDFLVEKLAAAPSLM